MTVLRPVLVAFGFFSVLFLSPWFTLASVIALSLRYRAWEAIFIGLLMDLLWIPSDSSIHLIPTATIAAIAIVIVFEPLRNQLLT
jgi:hypothetical protein